MTFFYLRERPTVLQSMRFLLANDGRQPATNIIRDPLPSQKLESDLQ